jgi:hypothetical protein
MVSALAADGKLTSFWRPPPWRVAKERFFTARCHGGGQKNDILVMAGIADGKRTFFCHPPG